MQFKREWENMDEPLTGREQLTPEPTTEQAITDPATDLTKSTLPEPDQPTEVTQDTSPEPAELLAEAATEATQGSLPEPPEAKVSVAEKYGINKRLFDFWNYAVEKAAQSLEERIASYNAEKGAFEAALELWLPEDRDKLRGLLEASRFVDYVHMAVDIMDTYRSRGETSILEYELQHLYNRNLSPDDPEFTNMRKVNQFLKVSTEAPSLDRLRTVAAIAGAGGVDEIEEQELGAIRSYPVVGWESDDGISPLEARRINQNVYLIFVEDGRYKKRKEKTGCLFGKIVYPEPITVKAAALERIKDSHQDVYERVLAFRAQSRAAQGRAERDQEQSYLDLTQALVTALAEERYAYYAAEREKLGELDTPQKIINYVKLAAHQEQEIISIHPLVDFNGRSTRFEILYDLLDKVGISRPRMNNPDSDLYESPSGYLRAVQLGILSTDGVYRDMTERITHGLRIENSPDLLFPALSRSVGIHLQVRGKKDKEKNISQMDIDGQQFGAYVDLRFSMDRKLERRFNKQPLQVMMEMREDYKQFAKDHLLYAHIPGKATELVGVRLVDFDFRRTFGLPFAGNKEQWDFKIDRWYKRELIWRGMPDEEKVTDEQILALFHKFSWLGVCNSMVDYWDHPHEDVREWIDEEFERYNRDVITGDLCNLVFDHTNEGPLYDESYGLSTSSNWGLANGFAWGRGAYGYNNDEVKSAQPQIRSRLLMGAYPALKDVVVPRLKFIDERFSDKHGRQEETMVVGAIDPDAVMFVQEIDAKRRVERSWVRNPDRPQDVWVITGRYRPEDGPLEQISPERVKAIHSLPCPADPRALLLPGANTSW